MSCAIEIYINDLTQGLSILLLPEIDRVTLLSEINDLINSL